MRSIGAVVAVLLASTSVAAADDHALYEQLWPEVPTSTRLTMSQQITDQLTELGNTVGHHMNVLSNEMLMMQFDGRRRRAHVRLGINSLNDHLTFSFAGDVHFTQGVARVQATLDVGIAGHVVSLEIPDFEMAPASYRGERGVEIRVPLYKRTF